MKTIIFFILSSIILTSCNENISPVEGNIYTPFYKKIDLYFSGNTVDSMRAWDIATGIDHSNIIYRDFPIDDSDLDPEFLASINLVSSKSKNLIICLTPVSNNLNDYKPGNWENKQKNIFYKYLDRIYNKIKDSKIRELYISFLHEPNLTGKNINPADFIVCYQNFASCVHDKKYDSRFNTILIYTQSWGNLDYQPFYPGKSSADAIGLNFYFFDSGGESTINFNKMLQFQNGIIDFYKLFGQDGGNDIILTETGVHYLTQDKYSDNAIMIKNYWWDNILYSFDKFAEHLKGITCFGYVQKEADGKIYNYQPDINYYIKLMK